MTKACSKCKVEKPLDAFWKASAAKDGRCSACKDRKKAVFQSWAARNPDYEVTRYRNDVDRHRSRSLASWHAKTPEAKRDAHLRSAYGITLNDELRLNDEQGGVCAICSDPPPPGRRLYIDHNHRTGAVRGLLCFSCNVGISRLKDSPEVLIRAAQYVARDLANEGKVAS